VFDSVSGMYLGDLVGTPTRIQGTIGRALAFGGVDDPDSQYVTVTSPVELDLGTHYTIAAWIRTSDAEQEGSIVTCIGNPELQVRLSMSELMGLAYAATDASWPMYDVHTPAAPIGDGVWHHIALSVDDAHLALYVDGFVASTEDLAGTLANEPVTGVACYVARGRDWEGNSPFGGDVDEVLIYRRALGDGEIGELAAIR